MLPHSIPLFVPLRASKSTYLRLSFDFQVSAKRPRKPPPMIPRPRSPNHRKGAETCTSAFLWAWPRAQPDRKGCVPPRAMSLVPVFLPSGMRGANESRIHKEGSISPVRLGSAMQHCGRLKVHRRPRREALQAHCWHCQCRSAARQNGPTLCLLSVVPSIW